MATKSILKQVIIKNRTDCKNFVAALEHAAAKKSKEVNAPKIRVASVEDVKKMFGA